MLVLAEILEVAADAQLEGRTSAVDLRSSRQPGLSAGLRTSCPALDRDGRILIQIPQLDPVTASPRDRVFDAIRRQLRSWLDFFSGAECLGASIARAIAQTHSADELVEPLNEFSSHWRRAASHESNRGRSSRAARCSRNRSLCDNSSFWSPS
jgi:hypothetical protein